MLKYGLNPLSDNDYEDFFNLLVNDDFSKYRLSNKAVTTINNYNKIVEFFGYNWKSSALIVKHAFKELFSSNYRWVRKAIASCPIFNADDIKTLVSNSSDRYILIGFLSNPNLSVDLKIEINNLLKDKTSFPIQKSTYSIVSVNQASPIEVNVGICDLIDLISLMKDTDEFDLIDKLRDLSFSYDDIYGINDTADAVLYENETYESISLSNNHYENDNYIQKVENGKIAFCINSYEKVRNPLNNWKKYSIELEEYFDPSKITIQKSTISIEGYTNYSIISGYTYKNINEEEIDFIESDDFSSVGVEQSLTLYFGLNNKWVEIDFNNLSSSILSNQEFDLSNNDKAIKFLNGLINKN